MRYFRYLPLVIALGLFCPGLYAQFAPRSIPTRQARLGGGSSAPCPPEDKTIDEDWFDEELGGSGGSSTADSLVSDTEPMSIEEYAEAQAWEQIPDVDADTWEEQEVIDAKLLYERQNLIAKLVRTLTVRAIKENSPEDKADLIAEANRQYQRDLKDNQQYLREYRLAQFNYQTGDGFCVLPSWSKYHTQAFFEGLDYDEADSKLFKNNLVSFSTLGEAASTYNEIIYDYLGPLRVSVGTLLSMAAADYEEPDDEYLEDNALQRFLGGGGNFVLGLAYPLLYANLNNTNTLLADVILYPRVSFDVPKLAAQSDLGAVNCDLGLEGSVYAAGLLGNIAFFGRGRLAMMNGNKAFFENLGASNKPHYFSQLSVGVAVTSMFRIYYSWYFDLGDQFIRDNFRNMISISIIPIDNTDSYGDDWE